MGEILMQMHRANQAARARLGVPPFSRPAPKPQPKPVPQKVAAVKVEIIPPSPTLPPREIKIVVNDVARCVPILDLRPTVRKIAVVVGYNFGLSPKQILSRSRQTHISRPRMYAMYVARAVTRRSLPDLGRRLGGFDHTSILHGLRRTEECMRADPNLKTKIEGLIALLSTQREEAIA